LLARTMDEQKMKVVITGVGVVSPIGNTKEQFEASLLAGRDGISINEFHDTQGYRSNLAGQVKNFSLPKTIDTDRVKSFATVDQYALAAAEEAILDAHAMQHVTSVRTGIVLGSGGSVIDIDRYMQGSLNGENPSARKLMNYSPDTSGTLIAEYYQLHGPRTSIMTACSSGATAIAYGADLIRYGYADMMLVGGCESLSYVTLSGFNSLTALATGKCKPFDKERDGIVLGEGAAIMILESEESAKKRGATIYAELAGYGLTADAYHITAPHPDGLGMSKAMNIAMTQAGIDKSQVAYINAHGTGTELNDKSESQAIGHVFGEHAAQLCVSSTKSMMGHCLSAAGAIETVATVLALKGQFVPPTINYETTDPDCPLDYVPNTARNLAYEYAMSNSLAFGGNNTSLLLKAWS